MWHIVTIFCLCSLTSVAVPFHYFRSCSSVRKLNRKTKVITTQETTTKFGRPNGIFYFEKSPKIPTKWTSQYLCKHLSFYSLTISKHLFNNIFRSHILTQLSGNFFILKFLFYLFSFQSAPSSLIFSLILLFSIISLVLILDNLSSLILCSFFILSAFILLLLHLSFVSYNLRLLHFQIQIEIQITFIATQKQMIFNITEWTCMYVCKGSKWSELISPGPMKIIIPTVFELIFEWT